MHLLITFYLIVSIAIIYSQCNNAESVSNPTLTSSQHRRTLLSSLRYSAKKQPFVENWRLLQVSVGSTAPIFLSTSSWKSPPLPAHVVDQKKRQSHTSLKKRRPICSVVSVTPKLRPRARPIKNPSLTPRETIATWSGISNKSTTQPQPPPSPNIDHFTMTHPLAQRPIKQPSSRLSNPGRLSASSLLSTTQFLPQTSSKMVTRQGTD
jgi:hypothetical protein